MSISINNIDGYAQSKIEISTPKMVAEKNNTETLTHKINEIKENESKENEKSKIENQDGMNKQVQQSVKDMNQLFSTLNQKLSFEIFEDKTEKSKQHIYVALVDKETEKVVKEIPTKEILEMRARIQEYVGLLVDQRI